MANNYNLTVPDKQGYPSQSYVDEILNRIDDCPTAKDIEDLLGLGEEEAKEYVRKKFEDLQKEMKSYFDGVSESLQEKIKPIEPLIEPPTDLAGVIEYCKALVEYFTDPHTKMIEMTAFYAQFSQAVTNAIANKANDMGV